MAKNKTTIQDLPVPYLGKGLTGYKYKKNNETVIAAQYQRGYSFCPHSQTAVVAWNIATNNNNVILKWGIIDINGNSVAINDPDHFTWMTTWQVGKQVSYSSFTTNNDVSGIINSKGQVVLKGEKIFNIIIDDAMEIATLQVEKHFRFLDLLTGKLSEIFSEIISPFDKEGCCFVKNLKGDLQLMDKTTVVETFGQEREEEIFLSFA